MKAMRAYRCVSPSTTVHVTLNDRQLLGSLIMAVPTRILLKLTGTRAPDEVKPYRSTLDPAFGRRLSIALAMKGGVSLAVWIGGAVSELDILRRIRIVRTASGARRAYFLADPGTRRNPKEKNGPPMDAGAFVREQFQTLLRADAYARILLSRGYDGVDIDVLAGASAGKHIDVDSVIAAREQDARIGVGPQQGLELFTDEGPGIHRRPVLLLRVATCSGVGQEVGTTRPARGAHDTDPAKDVELRDRAADPDRETHPAFHGECDGQSSAERRIQRAAVRLHLVGRAGSREL